MGAVCNQWDSYDQNRRANLAEWKACATPAHSASSLIYCANPRDLRSRIGLWA